MRIGLHGGHIDNTENVVIHDVLWRFFVLGLSGLLNLGLLGLFLFWLSGGGDSNFPMLLGGFIFGDVVIVVDGTGAGHLQGLDIEVHVCFSDGDVLEGLDGGLEGGDCDANLFLPVGVPAVLEQFGILAGSLLDLKVRMRLETANHLHYPFAIAEFLIELQEGGQTIRNSIVADSSFEDDALDEIEYSFFGDLHLFQFEQH